MKRLITVAALAALFAAAPAVASERQSVCGR